VEEEARNRNTGAALVLFGGLLFFIAYLVWRYQDCYQYQQILGTTYCIETYYPFRIISLFVGFLGFGSFIGGLWVIGKG